MMLLKHYGQIFNRYARSKGYEDWQNLYYSHKNTFYTLYKYILEACDLVQKEQQKRIAENYAIDRLYGDFNDLKNSILSENNLIK